MPPLTCCVRHLLPRVPMDVLLMHGSLRTHTTPLPCQAVEPTMKVEKEDKGLLAFAPVALVAVGAALAVPLLPLLFGANPDQA